MRLSNKKKLLFWGKMIWFGWGSQKFPKILRNRKLDRIYSRSFDSENFSRDFHLKSNTNSTPLKSRYRDFPNPDFCRNFFAPPSSPFSIIIGCPLLQVLSAGLLHSMPEGVFHADGEQQPAPVLNQCSPNTSPCGNCWHQDRRDDSWWQLCWARRWHKCMPAWLHLHAVVGGEQLAKAQGPILIPGFQFAKIGHVPFVAPDFGIWHLLIRKICRVRFFGMPKIGSRVC